MENFEHAILHNARLQIISRAVHIYNLHTSFLSFLHENQHFNCPIMHHYRIHTSSKAIVCSYCSEERG